MPKNKSIYFIALILFILVAGGTYVIFSKTQEKVVPAEIPAVKKLANGSTMFDDSLPKTQPCPLNGVKYSTQQEDWWKKHRPLGVMIENSVDARPQSGLSFADIIYEAVAEGGITRFLGIYYCQDAPVLGPIRSARTYFVDFVSEYGDYPLYAHVGGANAPGPADALGQIESYGWNGYNDLNQFSVGFPTYYRDYNRLGHTVATEHTMYAVPDSLWKIGADRKLTNIDKDGNTWDAQFVTYTFKEDAVASSRPAAQSIHLQFWQGGGDYDVDWIYDPQANNYKRNNGGAPHIDLDTHKQLTAKNIVVLHMLETGAADGYMNDEHRIYQDKGTGKADVFIDGKQIPAIWKKATRTSRTLLYDLEGNPIQFDRGNIWFTILPLTGVLTVK